MAVFASDSFAGTANSNLTAHSANWVARTGSILIDATGTKATRNATTCHYYYTASPAGADYAVRALIDLGGVASSVAGLTARNATAADHRYYARAVVTTPRHQLYRVVSGASTLIVSVTATGVDAAGENAAELRVVTTGAQVDLEWWWGGALVISYADTSASRITDAGYPGISSYEGTRDVTTWDAFEAEDIGGAPSFPTLSLPGVTEIGQNSARPRVYLTY